VLDTGSANLWIPDTSLLAQTRNRFDCKASPTCLRSQSPGYLSLMYGQGAVQGYKITDRLNLGGLVIPEYSMMLAVDVKSIQLNNFDGILGLSLGRFYPEFPTILERLKGDGLINTSTFSMYLGDDATSTGSNTGELIFGGYDPQYALSEFQFVKVRTEKETLFWSADIHAMGFGDSINITNTTLPVIFDSGTSFLLLPGNLIQGIVQQAQQKGVNCNYLPALQQYMCDCNGREVLDDLVFYFENVALNVSAHSYIFNDYGTCILAIQASPATPSLSHPIILGDVFLKNYYTMYSANNYTVGFAKAAPVKYFPTWIIFLIILGIAILIIVIVSMRSRKGKSSSGNYTAWNNSKGVVIGGSRRKVSLTHHDRVQETGERNTTALL